MNNATLKSFTVVPVVVPPASQILKGPVCPRLPLRQMNELRSGLRRGYYGDVLYVHVLVMNGRKKLLNGMQRSNCVRVKIPFTRERFRGFP